MKGPYIVIIILSGVILVGIGYFIGQNDSDANSHKSTIIEEHSIRLPFLSSLYKNEVTIFATMPALKKTVIITAAGVGKRMKSKLPKQFSNLNGKPILMHTIRRFYKIDPNFELILTLPEKHLKTWKKLCVDHQFDIPHHTVNGGKERFHSVKNALNFSTGDLIAIHDGVRPIISRKLVTDLFIEAEKKGAVVPAIEINESLRKIGKTDAKAVDRSKYRIIQTPQVFKKDIIVKAYQNTYHNEITDDATLVERIGQRIHLIEGDVNNIKITYPRDMLLVENLLS